MAAIVESSCSSWIVPRSPEPAVSRRGGELGQLGRGFCGEVGAWKRRGHGFERVKYFRTTEVAQGKVYRGFG